MRPVKPSCSGARTEAALSRQGLPPLAQASVELLGSESHFGAAARAATREVDVKVAARHPSAAGIAAFLREMVGLALTAPPGLTGFAGARPRPTPVVRLFSFLLSKTAVTERVEVAARPPITVAAPPGTALSPVTAQAPPTASPCDDCVPLPLERLAFGRSGDKGDKANIGVLARHRDFLPWIGAALTEQRVAELFDHFLAADGAVQRFYLPGCGAFNYLLHSVLGGGGVASLRADPQGKSYAQLLLTASIDIPRSLALQHGLTGAPGEAGT